ncbi:MAG: EF-hand domain-containing protein [Candidatus Sphingomonas phytovorans]|nr:EF-hand domain-containing protein [Sphingomonas sp.]WEK01163.1 MAG: EF-hand domain-containing protein [Sphingomonas sp.]
MRIILLSCLALATTGCVSDRSLHRGRPHAEVRRGGPGMGPDGSPARLFISPMGEPFRAARGEGRPEDQWFRGGDTNGDGMLTAAEFTHDAARFFAVLDRGGDGEIDPADIEFYETVLAPEIRVGGDAGSPGGGRGGGTGGRRGSGGGGGRMGGGGGGMRGGGGQAAGDATSGGEGRQRQASARQGAARFGYLDFAEPVTSADGNFNRGVSLEEFAQAATKRFALLDKDGDGALTQRELAGVRGR